MQHLHQTITANYNDKPFAQGLKDQTACVGAQCVRQAATLRTLRKSQWVCWMPSVTQDVVTQGKHWKLL